METILVIIGAALIIMLMDYVSSGRSSASRRAYEEPEEEEVKSKEETILDLIDFKIRNNIKFYDFEIKGFIDVFYGRYDKILSLIKEAIKDDTELIDNLVSFNINICICFQDIYFNKERIVSALKKFIEYKELNKEPLDRASLDSELTSFLRAILDTDNEEDYKLIDSLFSINVNCISSGGIEILDFTKNSSKELLEKHFVGFYNCMFMDIGDKDYIEYLYFKFQSTERHKWLWKDVIEIIDNRWTCNGVAPNHKDYITEKVESHAKLLALLNK